MHTTTLLNSFKHFKKTLNHPPLPSSPHTKLRAQIYMFEKPLKYEYNNNVTFNTC